MKFLYSEEVLNITPELLEQLLEIDKIDFENLLKIPLKELTFDSFEDDSLLDYFWSLLDHYKNVNSDKKITDEIITRQRGIFGDKSNNEIKGNLNRLCINNKSV